MKRPILLSLLVASVLNVSNYRLEAQETSQTHHFQHNKKFWAGGSLTLWSDKETKETNVVIRPEFGHFISSKVGIGLFGGFAQEEGQRHYSITPFTRLYILDRTPFNIYLDGGIGFSWGQTKLNNSWSKPMFGYEIGVRPGACLDLVEGLCLCLRMGFLGYRNKFVAGEEPELTPSGFGLRFAPEELMIGLEIEF